MPQGRCQVVEMGEGGGHSWHRRGDISMMIYVSEGILGHTGPYPENSFDSYVL